MTVSSSPIAFPKSPSPFNSAKRPRPQQSDAPKPAKPRVFGGFLADDSDDDNVAEQPSPKRRMLQQESQCSPDDDAMIDSQLEKDPVNPFLQPTQNSVTTPPDSQPVVEDAEEAERYERLFGTQTSLQKNPFLGSELGSSTYRITTCSGKTIPIWERKPAEAVPYSAMVAARSRHKEGRAHKSYYGIPIHELIDNANKELARACKESTTATSCDQPVRSVEDGHTSLKKPKRAMLWTEKYRARTFMDLVGDDLTNRQVLRWLKRWDPIVFPHSAKPKAVAGAKRAGAAGANAQGGQQQQTEEEKLHRKILMLHGPPGLGKTTLAHVCARQAGYEVLEINASDERSKDVVKGRIRTALGTETVKTVENRKAEPGKKQKIARPVCVVVDEVDGVVGGSGGSGEGGFVKALIDLILLDQKNSSGAGSTTSGQGKRKNKKADDFRQMRPLILICNDVYHPSLRPLRQSGLAEIIHVGKPSVEAVVNRLKSIFEKEGIRCDKDAARKLCEATWGITNAIDAKRGSESNAEGDLRGVMVVGEWVAGRLKATSKDPVPHLTREWIDKHVLHELAHGGGGARGLGRGNVREIVARIFQEGAGFPKPLSSGPSRQQPDKTTRHEQPQQQLGVLEQTRKYAMERLREMIDTSGEADRIMTEVFLDYPNHDFNDDSFLSKPDAAYEWLYFHDACSSRVLGSQEWELTQYIAQPILACHYLFATPRRYQSQLAYGTNQRWGAGGADLGDDQQENAQPLPFTGPRADFAAHEAEKANRAALQGIQAQLSPSLARAFRSPEHIATDFLPYLLRMVSPDVKPVVVGGSSKDGGGSGPVASVRREGEKAMVRRAAQVLAEIGVQLLKGRLEGDGLGGRTQWVYRMEPDLETLATFESAGAHVLAAQAPTRYAVRQVLDQELQKVIAQRENAARQARLKAGGSSRTSDHDHNEHGGDDDKENRPLGQNKENTSSLPVKRDFFGRPVLTARPAKGEGTDDGGSNKKRKRAMSSEGEEGSGSGSGIKVWVTYHEGINNAVRKPISLEEFLRGF